MMNRDAILALLGFVLGVLLTYWACGTSEVVIESPAPTVTWRDGSVTAARVIDAKPKLPAPSKPKGGKTIRTVEVTVKTGPVPEQGTEKSQPCAPVNLRIDLDQYKDGIRASVISDSGTIIDAADYPVSPLIRPTQYRWAVGIEHHALAIDRDLGRLRLGVSVGDGEVRYRALVRF